MYVLPLLLVIGFFAPAVHAAPTPKKVPIFLGAGTKCIRVDPALLSWPEDIAFDTVAKRVYAIVLDDASRRRVVRTWDLSGRLVSTHPLPAWLEVSSILFMKGTKLELLMGKLVRMGSEWGLLDHWVVTVPTTPAGEAKVGQKVESCLDFDNSLAGAHAEHVRALMRKFEWFSAGGGQVPDLEVKKYQANARMAQCEDWAADSDYSIICYCWNYGEVNLARLQPDGAYRQLDLVPLVWSAVTPIKQQFRMPRNERIALAGRVFAIGTRTLSLKDVYRPEDDRWRVVWFSVGKDSSKVAKVHPGHLARVLERFP